jgi:hypothetical protein
MLHGECSDPTSTIILCAAQVEPAARARRSPPQQSVVPPLAGKHCANAVNKAKGHMFVCVWPLRRRARNEQQAASRLMAILASDGPRFTQALMGLGPALPGGRIDREA